MANSYLCSITTSKKGVNEERVERTDSVRTVDRASKSQAIKRWSFTKISRLISSAFLTHSVTVSLGPTISPTVL